MLQYEPVLLIVAFAVGASSSNLTSQPAFIHPLIQDYGGIVVMPEALYQPKSGAKVIIDIKSERRTARGVLQGLNAAALINNQYAKNQFGQKQVMEMVVVLHGPATKAALNDQAYMKHAIPDQNPDQELVRRLHSAGVEIVVCGQALAHHKYGTDEVAPEVKVAVSAATVNITRQMDGFAYIPFLE